MQYNYSPIIFPFISYLPFDRTWLYPQRNLTESQHDSLARDLTSLNLSRYMSEVAGALTEARLKMSDLPTAIHLCSLLHARYHDFAPTLLVNWQKVLSFKKDEKVCYWDILDDHVTSSFGHERLILASYGIQPVKRSHALHCSLFFSWLCALKRLLLFFFTDNKYEQTACGLEVLCRNGNCWHLYPKGRSPSARLVLYFI